MRIKSIEQKRWRCATYNNLTDDIDGDVTIPGESEEDAMVDYARRTRDRVCGRVWVAVLVAPADGVWSIGTVYLDGDSVTFEGFEGVRRAE